MAATKGSSAVRQPPTHPWVQADSSTKSTSGTRSSSMAARMLMTLSIPSTARYRSPVERASASPLA